MTFLSRDQIDQTLEKLDSIAEAHNIRIVIAGGLAMHHYGSPRMTADIDVISDSHQNATLILENNDIEELLTFGGVSASLEGTRVDVIVRNDKYQRLYQEAFNLAERLPGTHLYILTPEHLAVIKLAAGRRKDENDLEYLICAKKIDVEKASSIVEEHLGPYAVDSFNQIVDICEIMGSLPRRGLG